MQGRIEDFISAAWRALTTKSFSLLDFTLCMIAGVIAVVVFTRAF